MSTDLEIVDLTEIVGTLELPCDYSDCDWCPKAAAKWAATLKCTGCTWGDIRLLCDCKDFLLATEDALQCTACGEVVAPARRAIAYIEPIDRKTA